MTGAILLLPLYACMTWTGTTLLTKQIVRVSLVYRSQLFRMPDHYGQLQMTDVVTVLMFPASCCVESYGAASQLADNTILLNMLFQFSSNTFFFVN
jgi:hypothetical protein